jgi:hypothetical protein
MAYGLPLWVIEPAKLMIEKRMFHQQGIPNEKRKTPPQQQIGEIQRGNDCTTEKKSSARIYLRYLPTHATRNPRASSFVHRIFLLKAFDSKFIAIILDYITIFLR